MSHPLPLPYRLSLRYRLSDEYRTEKTTFGVTPADIDSIVRSWSSNAVAVHAIDVEPLSVAHGPSSRVARALNAAAGPAERALASVGTRLTDLSAALTRFRADAVSSDTKAATAFDALRDR